MDINVVLNAKIRTEKGKGPAKRLRRAGKIPAIFYGKGQEARMLTIDYRELKNAIYSGESALSLLKLLIEGPDGTEEKTVTVKDHQTHPLKRTVDHVDFLEINVNQALELEVPLVLTGKAIGVERGGMLSQIRQTLTVAALPINIPDQIVVDVSNLDLGESLHISDVPVPAGVELPSDVDFTVATILSPKGAKTEEDGEGEEDEAAEEGAAE